jgi:hypothetical protein
MLQRAEFDQLKEALKVRNALVHGLAVPRIDAALPTYLTAVAQRLLADD